MYAAETVSYTHLDVYKRQLQNCAANLCGMITPFGNPQNLYLFSYYDLSAKTFFSVMLPPFIQMCIRDRGRPRRWSQRKTANG